MPWNNRGNTSRDYSINGINQGWKMIPGTGII
jgi:hypothetical protein